MLDKRLTNLLSLLTQDDFKTVDTLAEKMRVSSKTLRNLIKELNVILEKHGAHIVTKRGEGFMLEVENLNAFQTLFLRQTKEIPSDSSERVRFIIEQFLKNSDYIKMEDICDAIYVSRKTLTADIKKAENFFKENHLSLERKPHYGMRLVGDEFQLRHCLVRYMQLYNGGTVEYEDLIEPVERQIADYLMEVLEHEDYHVSDVGLNSLVLHIEVSIKRIREEQYISIEHADFQKFISEDDYRLAKKCAEHIGEKMNVCFPKEEIRYLSIHFAGKESHQNLVIRKELQDAVEEMLQEIYEVFQIDFRDDLELVMSLGRHLVPLIIRMRYGMRLRNPLLQEVKTRYSFAYTMAVQACAVLERRYHSILDSNETSYIALILALSLERHRKQLDKKKVLFVCASGAGTARLMAYKIQESFGDYVGGVTICDQLSVAKQDFSKIDYVFTTVPIRDRVPVPICEIKQFFQTQETADIRRFLNTDQERATKDYYPEELFFTDIQADTKKAVLEELIGRIRKKRSLPQGFYQAVMKREELARTCMGNRVAMPHPCKVMTEDTFVSVAILREPVLWDEDQMVQAVFLVSVSKKKNKKIQNFYSATARLLLHQESMDTLIDEKDYQTLIRLLEVEEKKRSE